MTDYDLLRGYASSGSEDDFATLVGRYANLVYSAALRQTRQPHDAEEISQAVFIILARKAGTFSKDTVLAGWLVRTTRFVALNARRRDAHRWRVEGEAMTMSMYVTETESAWKQIAPVLDEALVSLSDQDRDAVALRFFEQKSFKDIASTLGTSEDNAQKRVSRALNKLRALCVKRGVVASATIFAGAIATNAVLASPGSLAAVIINTVVSGTAAAASVLTLTKATMAALERARLRTLASKGMAVALILLLVLVVPRWIALNTVTPATGGANIPNRATPRLAGTDSTYLAGAIPADLRTNTGQLRFRVVDAQTGAPIRNARVTSNGGGGFPDSVTSLTATDNNGEALISFNPNPAESWNLLIEIIKDGYVPRFVSWNAARGDLIEDIPAAYTNRLARGQMIGGLVMSENGDAVPDVKITLGGPGPRLVDGDPNREGVTIRHVEVTDANGRWLCNHIPAQLDGIGFQLSHPDFVAAAFGVAKFSVTTNFGTINLLEADFRNQTAVMMVKHGLTVSGMVADENGNPIAGAKVTRNRAWHDPAASETTGADGRFRFGNAAAQDLILTVQAEGFVAKDMKFRVSGNTNEVRFELAVANVLRGQVVDESGKPMERAVVSPAGSDFNNDRFSWIISTDERGKFRWLSAPPSQRSYNISDSHSYSFTNVDIAPDGVEHLITLRKVAKRHRFRIAGTVTDMQTGKTLDGFEVWVARRLRQGTITWGLGAELLTTGEEGRFAFLTPDPSGVESYAVEIKANGYLPAKMTVPGPLTTNYQVDFTLSAVSALTGMVQMPDGQPAAGAVVMLQAKAGDVACMRLPGQLDLGVSIGGRTLTDDRGVFSLSVTGPTGTVFIAHNSGYSEATSGQVAATHAIRLKPWGQVSGLLMIGGQPGTNETILLDSFTYDTGSSLNLASTATTDVTGHFHFDGIAPGMRKISHQLRAGGRRTRTSPLTQTARILVSSGGVTQVVLGGSGRKVAGKLHENEPGHHIKWQSCDVTLTATMPGPPLPSREEFGSDGEFANALRSWLALKSKLQDSEAGRQALRNSHGYFAAPQPDGTFVVNDVLPGVYVLKVTDDPRDGVLRSFRPDEEVLIYLLESMTREVIVPEATGTNAAPLDLGILVPTLKNP